MEATSTTDIILNNPAGPFNNMGVPGAKSYHLLYDGYGNPNNLQAGLANPYFVRMASSPTATILGDAMAQSPSFFSLWIGNNDILGYALSGGDGSNPITPLTGGIGIGFTETYAAIVTTLTSQGAQGVVANIPNVTNIPHFTTVPYNPLDPTNPDFGPQIPTLNAVFGQLNQVFTYLGVPERNIVFSNSEASAVVIKDESLQNLSSEIETALNASPNFKLFVQSFGLSEQAAPLVANLFGMVYGQARQATEDDLLVLPSSNVIGTINSDFMTFLMNQNLPAALAGQFSIEGISLPLEDKWVLIPNEQDEIEAATNSFNAVIDAVRSDAGLAYVDTNTLLNTLATDGLTSGNYNLSSKLVVGGVFSLDGVHLTARGYSFLANEFMKAIDATYESNFEESGMLINVGNYPTNYSPALQ
ncbi:G-D-S-L family lipolytic protein [Aestuariibaculum sediminum]|uniref:G-D-S-L family lipolytic protein n=1 Tax=Aestuariibaculum sediminum TaxID=2770637 RepID=UPI00293BD3BB|nr:G-D-S-L family lipolytic protein [Aestuariibaculum sediminum]